MKILTVKQVSDFLQLKPMTLYRWVKEGRIPCFKINGSVRFDEADIVKWVRGCSKNMPDEHREQAALRLMRRSKQANLCAGER